MSDLLSLNKKTPVFLDFETYMDKSKGYSLSRLSDVQYITDPRFQALSVAIKVNGRCTVYPGNIKLWEEKIAKLNDDEHIFVAHNARFDFRILSIRYGIHLRWMTDTMLMARYLGYPKTGLGDLSERLLSDRKLEMNSDGKRLENFTIDDWRRLARYNAKDVELTARLYQIFAFNLPPMELPLIDQTLKLCFKPHSIDWKRVDTLIVDLKQSFERLENSYPELIGNRSSPIWIRNYIRNYAGVDPQTIDKKKVVLGNLPESAQRVLKTVWEAKEIEKERAELETLRQRMTSGTNTCALIDLNYSKAVTHRWSSGGEGNQSFNMQNMRRDSGIRTVWIPDLGCAYVIVDLSQIEARVAAWYAGERMLLQAFADKRCVYCDFGFHVFGHVLDKATEKSERQLCKQAVLGLQFGMGADRFHQTLQTQAPDQLKMATVRLGASSDESTVKRVVEIYRRTYSKLAGLPAIAQKTFLAAIAQAPCQQSAIRTVGRQGQFCVSYDPAERILSIHLPSGSPIHYRDVSVEKVQSQFGYSECQISYAGLSGKKKALSYSMPFENVVQATARDIMAYQLLESDRQGFDLRFHTHDEAVYQVPIDHAIESKLAIERIFETAPSALNGLPVSCEAHLSDRYTKDERYMKDFEQGLHNGGGIRK